MLSNADLAHDVAQEAALQAFLGLDRLRRAEDFGPWLSGIGLNISRHWLRARRQEDISWDTLVGGRYDAAREIPDEQVGPEERAEASELRAQVQGAIEGLPRGQRAAIVLYYLYGLTQVETAVHLGIEVTAVKARLHKARRTLRQRLRELWEDRQRTTPVQSPMVEMRIEGVRKDGRQPDEPKAVILLREVDGPRHLALWVRVFEGTLLASTLEHIEMPRPLTFAFMASILQAGDLTLREVQIIKLVGEIFIATALIEGPAGIRPVDARPSDALHLAALTGAPIRVAPEVLDVAGITIQIQTTRDEHGQEIIEQTVRHAATGEEVAPAYRGLETFAPIRVPTQFEWNIK
jgi:RNA polymerase sigma factor (sigma-70 family)